MLSKNGRARTALTILPMIFVLLVIALAAGSPAAGFAERDYVGNQGTGNQGVGNQGVAPAPAPRRAAELCAARRARHICAGVRKAAKVPAIHADRQGVPYWKGRPDLMS